MGADFLASLASGPRKPAAGAGLGPRALRRRRPGQAARDDAARAAGGEGDAGDHRGGKSKKRKRSLEVVAEAEGWRST